MEKRKWQRRFLKETCQHPRSTPVEVKTTLSKIIFKGQRPSATALTALASASIWQNKCRFRTKINTLTIKVQAKHVNSKGNLPHLPWQEQVQYDARHETC